MRRPRARPLPFPALAAVALATGACGSEANQIAASSPYHQGSRIFAQRCGGCHTLDIAGTQGSATNVRTREYKDGPNFNVRIEGVEDVLYAIRNGGFSSGPMPQNVVTGRQAEQVAQFVAKYAGREAKRPPNPQGASPAGAQ